MRTVPLLLLLSACEPPDPAPQGLEDLIRFTFTHYPEDEDGRNDVSLADAARNLSVWMDENVDDLTVGFAATLEHRLTDDDLDVLDPAPVVKDGPAALGVLVARWLPCTLDQWDGLYVDDAQGTLFPDSYIRYERRDKEGFDCYADGTCHEASWQADIEKELSALSVEYTFSLASGLRRTDAAPPDSDVPFPAHFSQSWMLAPAVLSNTAIGDFRQNYQLETAYPKDGGLVHTFAFWVHLESDLNTEASPFVLGYIAGLEETHDELTRLCTGE